MIDFTIALILWVVVIGYWIYCRNNAKKQQIVIAGMLKRFSESNDCGEDRLQYLTQTYHMARHWFFLPVIALTAVVYSVILLFRGGAGRVSEHTIPSGCERRIEDAILFMYAKRNPLTTFTCLVFICIALVTTFTFGAIFNFIAPPRRILHDASSKVVTMSGRLMKAGV
ncbi:MAG: hypothetical protein ACK5L6_02745 [Anaerorhabdus sp.]|uniref:hypothetical protein n=1 Tax=Anaerorhabdus sp. TaxID=1872524 RepID=UPI003A8B07A7